MKAFGIRKNMSQIIEILEKKHAIKMLLLIFGEVAYKEKLRKDLEIPSDTIDARLKEFIDARLLQEPKKEEMFPFKMIYPLTELGQQIARKLSYVFDATKEVIPVPKDEYAELARLLKVDNMTVEAWINERIRTFLER